jgi:hypothetical protein
MCEKLNCLIKKGYFYCRDTGERCPDGLFDKPFKTEPNAWSVFDGPHDTTWLVGEPPADGPRNKKPYTEYPLPKVGYTPPIIYSEVESEGFKLPD